MTKHTFLTHTECLVEDCYLCGQGLKYCTTCEGVARSLPTECPGRPMSSTQETRVINRESDYFNDKWRNL